MRSASNVGKHKHVCTIIHEKNGKRNKPEVLSLPSHSGSFMIEFAAMKRRWFSRMVGILGSWLASIALVLALMLLAVPDYLSSTESFDIRLSTVAATERFDLVGWLVTSFLGKVQDKISADSAKLSESERNALVEQYFQLARTEEQLHGQLLQRRASTVKVAELEPLETQLARKRAEK